MNSLETYIRDLRDIHSTGVGVAETTYYGSFERLLNDVGKILKPKVRCVIHPKSLGAGQPDGGLFTADQFPRGGGATGTPSVGGLIPSRGAIEVKPVKDDVWKIADSEQVGRYLKRYGQVLVTNYREFVLVGTDNSGAALKLESYRLAESESSFWAATSNPRKLAKEHDERFTEFLKRIMLSNAPLVAPGDVAWFLASYARDAQSRIEGADLPALSDIRTALEEALGIKFEGEKGEHFFKSTLVQTLFYGVFSAWVLWCKEHTNHERAARFDWRLSAYYLRVPVLRKLFHEVADPGRLDVLKLSEVLDWAGGALNRVQKEEFFRRFEGGEAVQYFYEPFLKAFDPTLRKRLGVWYTPSEVVRYMVSRVDTVLREEMNIADGLADENVYVLDPSCGTGAYLVEVLKCIAETLKAKGEDALLGDDLKRAAMGRVFGFEILPASFVVAHLQLGLLLQSFGAPLVQTGERAGVYLTNALTGWEPPTEPKRRLPFPEFEEERDAAERVKRESKILVVLGNPPYDAYGGVSPKEEQALVQPYKKGLISEWGIKKFNLDDLYVRFFRIAERRIVEKTGKGIVCYISNFSFLRDPSFVVMRQRLIQEFDALWFDSMNGDSRETGKLTPQAEPDPSIFSTEYNREGIKKGTVISLLLRKEERVKQPIVRFRQFWGVNKRAELIDSLKLEEFNSQYEVVEPTVKDRLSLYPSKASVNYLSWPTVADLCDMSPFRGFIEARRGALIDIERDVLKQRMETYYDRNTDWETLKTSKHELSFNAARFDAKAARKKVIAAESFGESNIRRYTIRPLENRWCYHSSIRPLWNEPRPELWAQCWEGNKFLVTRLKTEKEAKGSPLYFSSNLVDYQTIARNVSVIPFFLKRQSNNPIDERVQSLFSDGGSELKGNELSDNGEIVANLSTKARAYLTSLGFVNLDEGETAQLLWMHALAVGYSPNYLIENADGIRGNWPRIPLPQSKDVLVHSASLGGRVAMLLDPEHPAVGVIKGNIDNPLRSIGSVSSTGGSAIQTRDGDLKITAGWGHASKDGATMPGKGRIIEREYSEGEHKAVVEGAMHLNMTEEEAFTLLGKSTIDIYLNELAYWKNIPSRVWNYHIGGYQVIKKWLSYREYELLGRSLTTDEVRELTNIARRIAALLLLESSLDLNYERVAVSTYPWTEQE